MTALYRALLDSNVFDCPAIQDRGIFDGHADCLRALSALNAARSSGHSIKLESRSIRIKLFFAVGFCRWGMNKVGVASFQTAMNRWS
jgi:hypothetical protein